MSRSRISVSYSCMEQFFPFFNFQPIFSFVSKMLFCKHLLLILSSMRNCTLIVKLVYYNFIIDMVWSFYLLDFISLMLFCFSFFFWVNKYWLVSSSLFPLSTFFIPLLIFLVVALELRTCIPDYGSIFESVFYFFTLKYEIPYFLFPTWHFLISTSCVSNNPTTA